MQTTMFMLLFLQSLDQTKCSQKTGGLQLSAEVWSKAERSSQANIFARISFQSPDQILPNSVLTFQHSSTNLTDTTYVPLNKVSRSRDSESTTSQDTPSKRPNKSSAPVLCMYVWKYKTNFSRCSSTLLVLIWRRSLRERLDVQRDPPKEGLTRKLDIGWNSWPGTRISCWLKIWILLSGDWRKQRQTVINMKLKLGRRGTVFLSQRELTSHGWGLHYNYFVQPCDSLVFSGR